VYEWSSAGWVQRGADIDGEAPGDENGRSVALNADGAILAVGAPFNAGNGFGSGHVRVYEWSSAGWVQRGADIDGEAPGDENGWSVALSADGAILAVGAPFNAGNGFGSGHVRVYEWSSAGWVQRGADIDGEAPGDANGGSVALSADGAILAGDGYLNDDGGTSSGHVRVFWWPSSAPPAASSIMVSPGCSAILYEADDFSGAETPIGAGEHTIGSNGGPGAVRLLPRASVASSWEAALESQHGAGSVANYPHDTCRVQCCDETVDAYLDELHRVRELAMLGRDAEAADVAYSLCEGSVDALNLLSGCAAFVAVHNEACQLVAQLETSGDIFGAMPLWHYSSFDADMKDALDEMKSV
jgi:hypothetical protein